GFAHADHVAGIERLGPGQALTVDKRAVRRTQIFQGITARAARQSHMMSAGFRVINHDVSGDVTPDRDNILAQLINLIRLRSPANNQPEAVTSLLHVGILLGGAKRPLCCGTGGVYAHSKGLSTALYTPRAAHASSVRQ